jgi:signal transduction histidine kinase
MLTQRLTQHELENLRALQPDMTRLDSQPSDSPLLKLLASIDRNRLEQLIIERSCEPGEIICREGALGDALYLIWSGRVAVVKGDLSSPTILGLRGPGEIIGEMALLEDQPRSATNIALDTTRLLQIGREAFHEWLSSSPDIGRSIMAMLSARLRAAGDDRAADDRYGKQLVKRVSRLETEKQQLLELQRVRDETSDLIVHDLRNPLGIIYGALNMLEMVLPSDVLEANRDLLNLATGACERMQNLVDSLLDVAKLETGEMPITLSLTSLPPLLQEVTDQQSLVANMRGITFRLDIQGPLPDVFVDQEKLGRVLVNLLDNAMKYSPDGVPVTLTANAGDDCVTVSVIDEGPGIPENERERIFERFAQVAGTHSTRRGFGLGLTFCKLIIEALGGYIWVEPGPGDIGSRFSFTLPLEP